MFPSQSTGTFVALSTIEAMWLTSSCSGDAIRAYRSFGQRDHEDQEEDAEPEPSQDVGPADQRGHAGQPDQEREVAHEADGDEDGGQPPQDRHREQGHPEPRPRPDRHRAPLRRLVEEVEADQRHEEPVAVILVDRPDVEEMAEVGPEDQAEQPQAAERPDEGDPSLGLVDHPAYQLDQGRGVPVIRGPSVRSQGRGRHRGLP